MQRTHKGEILVLVLLVGSQTASTPSTVETSRPAQPSERRFSPSSAVSSPARVSVKIMRPVSVKDGKSDQPHTRGVVQVIAADGTAEDVEVLDFP